MGASACLYSTIKNVSGVKKRFAFVDYWGRELANNEEYSALGHPTQWIKQWRNWTPAHTAALVKSIEDGLVKIIKTPAVVLYDVVQNRGLTLHLDNNRLKTTDTCVRASATVTLEWIKDV